MTSEDLQVENLSAESDPLEIAASELAWSQAWQIPVLLLGLGLLLIGVYFALPRYSVPDYQGVLEDVEVHLSAGELEQAELKLVTMSEDDLYKKLAEDPVKAHTQQLFGDLFFRQIDKSVWQGITTPIGIANLSKIKQRYREAEKLGRDLPPPALRRYAQTLAALGEDEAALKIVDRMPTALDPPRYRLVRDLIERRVLTDPDPVSKSLARLIARYEQELDAEKNLQAKRAGQIWVMALKCERMLQADDPNGVISLLIEGGLLRLGKDGASERELAPLKVRLGEAYATLGQLENARLYLRKAQAHLPDGDPLNPRIMVAFGDIVLAEGANGAFEQAYNHYRQAYEADKMGPSSVDALIGLGHTEANRDNRFPEALKWFDRAVKRILTDQLPSWDGRRERLANYLRDIHVEREFTRGRYSEALELLKVYQPLEAPDFTARTLLAFASIYEKLGEESLAKAEAVAPGKSDPSRDPNLQARRIHNQEAAIAFEQAGDYYRRQATELTHTTDEHGDALWKAAASYEKAQLWNKAAEVYADFLETSDRQERREEASFRIAQALLAEGQYESAVQRLRQIIEDSPQGEFAKRSYVPAAQGLAAMKRWGEAEKLLRSVLEHHPSIGPENPYYHDAIVALGKLFYKRGADDPRFYARAIEVLGDEGGAVERYQHSEREEYQREMPTLRYMLADSLRLSADGLAEQAEEARTETERLAMLATRTERLADALMYYHMVITELEKWHPDSLTQLEQQYFRNAHFYMADCAFERGDFETAIGFYLNAVSQYQDHPVALVGWVQIMNARAELEQYEAARSAHARAIELFNQMPEGAFQRADSLMTRERWDDWLQWMTQLDLFKKGTATAGVPTLD
ncbi:MAG: tetratricopeptide repeat protein [Phycisphaeraceae bacterium]|nr:tetratricopeptide repeat protein [Phycisphaeraceae bacterium]